MDQHRGDGGIDAAREAADDPAGPHLAADLFDRLVAELKTFETEHGPLDASDAAEADSPPASETKEGETPPEGGFTL